MLQPLGHIPLFPKDGSGTYCSNTCDGQIGGATQRPPTLLARPFTLGSELFRCAIAVKRTASLSSIRAAGIEYYICMRAVVFSGW
jgi:hypothetical protein